MTRSGIASIDDLQEYLDRVPSRLGQWKRPGMGATSVAGELNYRASLLDDGSEATESYFRHVVGIGTLWAMRYMRPSPIYIPPTPWDREELWRTAKSYWFLRDDLNEVRSGLRCFEVHGNVVRLPYKTDLRMLTLDRVLDGADEQERLANHPASKRPARAAAPFVVSWFNARRTGTAPSWFCAPEDVREFFRSLASDNASVYSLDLPSGTVVSAGFSLADANAYWVELIALGLFMDVLHQMAFRSPYPPTHLSEIIPIYTRRRFIEGMASGAGIEVSASERITRLLTMTKERRVDPALTP